MWCNAHWSHRDWGREMCIDTATHLRCDNITHHFTISPCQLITYQLLPLAKTLILITYSMLWWKWAYLLPFTIRHDVALCPQLCGEWGGGQGPDGVRTLLYIHIHTDQEKWTVNHYAQEVVYTVLGSRNVTFVTLSHAVCEMLQAAMVL